MQTRPIIDPLQSKTWQLDTSTSGVNGYLYYCSLCDEALVCSKHLINPQKIQLAFNNSCPSCGFELDRVLNCQPSTLPPGRRLLTNLRCEDPEILLEPEDRMEEQARRASALSRDLQPDLTTGIDAIDRILVLKRGQLVYLHGEPSHALSLLLCVRATLPAPKGLDSDVVFIDAGNIFDAYAISHHAISLGLDLSKIHERIHLSRAFTHHQVCNLLMEKLSSALEEYNAGLAVVSDVTTLFCDPDVRDKKESLDIFRKSIRFIAETAEEQNLLIIVTNLKTRNKSMKDTLNTTAHVSASIKDKDAYTQLTVTRHPFIPQRQEEIVLDHGTLTEYFQ
jgi:Rad51